VVIKVPGREDNGFWELTVAKSESATNIGHIYQINGKYRVNQKVKYRISGDAGQILWESRILMLNGRVKLMTEEGKKLTADEMSWDPNISKVNARGNVHFETKDLSLNTGKLEADLDLNLLNFTGLTKATYGR
jgi:lipopolysaccharide assembly outer membrane protein LptD (OstA)